MDSTSIALLISLGVPLLSTVAGLVVTLIKDKRERKTKDELRMDAFYLNTSMNLVRSTETEFLLMTGIQKKEYVMARLENEIISAGIKVDKFKMSEAIEKAVSLMNTYKSSGKTPEELQALELVKMSNEKKAELEAANKKTEDVVNASIAATKQGLEAAEEYLNAKAKTATVAKK